MERQELLSHRTSVLYRRLSDFKSFLPHIQTVANTPLINHLDFTTQLDDYTITVAADSEGTYDVSQCLPSPLNLPKLRNITQV